GGIELGRGEIPAQNGEQPVLPLLLRWRERDTDRVTQCRGRPEQRDRSRLKPTPARERGDTGERFGDAAPVTLIGARGQTLAEEWRGASQIAAIRDRLREIVLCERGVKLVAKLGPDAECVLVGSNRAGNIAPVVSDHAEVIERQPDAALIA